MTFLERGEAEVLVLAKEIQVGLFLLDVAHNPYFAFCHRLHSFTPDNQVRSE